MVDDNELGRFLRSRREQSDPADFGFAGSGRRRTPGLRREEVAALAGISMDYLVRLEQGRDRRPSPSVVVALARALRLDGDEQTHLARIAACAVSPELCPRSQGHEYDVPDNVRRILDRLHPTPAFLVGPWYDLLACNQAWVAVMSPTGVLDEPAPNLARFMFTDHRAKDLYEDWSSFADQQVAILRDVAVRWRDDPQMHSFVDELCAIDDFARRWQANDVMRRRAGTKHLMHPVVGRLAVEAEVLELADDSDRRLVTWFAGDEVTAQRLEQLVAGEPGERRAGLRVVGN